MSNLIANWWRSRQFNAALRKGNNRFAEQLLQQIQNSYAKLSFLEKLFRDKLQFERDSLQYKREIARLKEKLQQADQKLAELEEKLELARDDNSCLQSDTEFINFVSKSFKLIEHDENKLQCTGIDQRIFNDLEASLVEYLQEEFSKYSPGVLSSKLREAVEDINCLKRGEDPSYEFSLTPHAYFMRYFVENVYISYLAWFFIYKQNLLPRKLNILDIAAGPGTAAYGLALLFRSSSGFFPQPPMHISYYSLEKQAAFQYRGLQFWRRYIESQKTATNAYFRFDTADIFTWDNKSSKLPKYFFDFIVVSHGFFSDPGARVQANNTYKEIFSHCLNFQGYVLLIIQDKKLHQIYNANQSEDHEQEKRLIQEFVAELGLDLVWYKYLTSTDSRIPYSARDFAKFAEENLPKQLYMSRLIKQHFGVKYDSNYKLDDYVILARR
jgi:hypothetical protein